MDVSGGGDVVERCSLPDVECGLVAIVVQRKHDDGSMRYATVQLVHGEGHTI